MLVHAKWLVGVYYINKNNVVTKISATNVNWALIHLSSLLKVTRCLNVLRNLFGDIVSKSWCFRMFTRIHAMHRWGEGRARKFDDIETSSTFELSIAARIRTFNQAPLYLNIVYYYCTLNQLFSILVAFLIYSR